MAKGNTKAQPANWFAKHKAWVLGVGALFAVWITLGFLVALFGGESPAAASDSTTNDRRAFTAYQRCVEREGLEQFKTCGEAWGIKFQDNYLRCPEGLDTTEDPELGTIVRCYDEKVSTE
ncbi:hypothetical protein [Saccharothrix sp. HUAS TT1]|uniref:hypothetical protein n=1 Tax=unclassified Saccharothrix TaxID=2593673 RepID=UPI00345C0DB3